MVVKGRLESTHFPRPASSREGFQGTVLGARGSRNCRLRWTGPAGLPVAWRRAVAMVVRMARPGTP